MTGMQVVWALVKIVIMVIFRPESGGDPHLGR